MFDDNYRGLRKPSFLYVYNNFLNHTYKKKTHRSDISCIVQCNIQQYLGPCNRLRGWPAQWLHKACKASILLQIRAVKTSYRILISRSYLKNHVEGYHELSAKTKSFFSAAVERWDAEFYVKVDDDVHVNLGIYSASFFFLFSSILFRDCFVFEYNAGTLAATLARHRSKPRVYIGCMKSGPVLHQK